MVDGVTYVEIREIVVQLKYASDQDRDAPFYRQENTAIRECRAFIQHGSWKTYRGSQ